MVNACHSSHSAWHLALRNFIMQIKNKLNNLIVSTFLLLFVNKIMFTKCFFSAPKVLFCEMGAFFAKNVLFFLGRVLFFAKVHYNPCIWYKYAHMSLIYAHQIFSDSDLQFLNGSHFGMFL